MRAHIPGYRTLMVPSLAFFVIALACTDFDRLVGLSGEQAPGDETPAGRPEERRAAELSRVVPGLAGFFYDTAGNVVVAVKGDGGAIVTRARLQPLFQQELARSRRRHPAADIVVHGAQYTFLELRNWRDRLETRQILSIPGVAWLDLDEVANRVVVGLEAAGDPGAVRALARAAGVPAEALDIERTTPYVSQSTLQDQFRPIQGGTQIQRVSGTSRVTCTLGFAALWNNQQVFLTAGHCSPNLMATDSVAQFQPIAPLTAAESAATTAIGREIFRYSEACGNRRCANSDAAIYGVMPSQSWGLGRIARPTYGCMPGPCSPVILSVSGYLVIDTTRQSFVVNDLVGKIGSATGLSQGLVTRTCVDVSPTNGATYHCQMFASYGANDGDSGSPILLDIQGGTDSTVTLGGIHSGKSGSNSVFSPWSGIVQDYGSLVVVPPAQDTARPVAPVGPLTLPEDSSVTVRRPGGRSDNVYYRNIFELAFDDSTSGLSVRTILSRYQAEIIGGDSLPRLVKPAYVIRVPDPGSTFEAVQGLLTQLKAEPGVYFARVMMFRVHWESRGRFPNEAPGMRRVNWQSPDSGTNGTRSRLAIRAPLAWGCETGTYGGQAVRVGVLDVVFASQHQDLPASRVFPVFDTTDFDLGLQQDRGLRSHGTGVAGVLSAIGDNSIGVTGILWSSDLQLYPYGQGTASVRDPIRRFGRSLADAARRNVRVMVSSLGFGDVADDDQVRRLRESLRDYLSAGAGNVFVWAAAWSHDSTPGRRLTLQQLQTTNDTTGLTPLDRALAQLLDTFPNQIILVGGTDSAGRLWTKSDFYTGGIPILAPATDVLTLADPADFPSGTLAWDGNSFAAPLVGGVAGLLLAADPTLTGPEVTSYILRGARQPRLNRQTGVFGPPDAVAGAPETVYQLDAYGALTLLASERSSGPLCGNRVWVAGTQLVAQRNTGAAPQVLADIGDTAAFVNVHHGGRRVDVWTDAFDPLSFVFTQQGTWTQSGNPPASPDGGAWNSLWSLSHDGDTAVTLVNHSGSGQVTLEVRRGPTGGSSTHVADIVVPLAFSGSDVCIFIDGPSGQCMDSRFVGTSEFVYSYTAAYSPLGDRVIVSVSTARNQTTSVGGMAACPWDTGPNPSQCRTYIDYSVETIGTTYHQITLPTGTDTVLATPTTAPVMVFWAAVAEDGGQLVTGEGVFAQTSTLRPDTNFVGFHQRTTSQSTTACTLRYRQASSGVVPRFETASDDVCRGPLGGGSVAPAPPISSRTH